jgi:hypothetical protein
MRIAGIILLILGGLTFLRSLGTLLARQSMEDEVSGAAQMKREDAFVPAIMLFALGTALIVFSRHQKPVGAVPAEQWFPITLTPAAAEFARTTIVERNYPAGSGLRIDTGKSQNMFVVQFDMPSDDANDWMGENLGIPVFVDKQFVDAVSGKTIDLNNNRLVLIS